MNIYQRNTLTVNHGTYFIDTSVPREVQYGDPTQKDPTNPRAGEGEKFSTITPCDFVDKDECEPRSVNVFERNQTYYVFFLYAKQSTEQTYQIYVGKEGFDTGTVKGVQMGINVAPAFASLVKTFQTRPTWLKKVQVDNGILTVNVDFNGVTELEPTAANLCQPKTFCHVKDNHCVSALVDSGDNRDPLLIANPGLEKEVNAVCGTWAVKDLDCPKDGCFGFSFTLPDKFKADATIEGPTPHRPRPAMFPDTTAPGQPDWTAKFQRTSTAPDNTPPDNNNKGGACFYPDPLPGNEGCEAVEPTGPQPRGVPRRRR
jgi:hypothetical protein